MSEQQINNYEAANEIDVFVNKYLNPLKERVEKAKNYLETNSATLGEKSLRELKNKREMMETKLIDFTRLKNKFQKLIRQHEELTSKLVQFYNEWDSHVAYKGRQQTEMLQSQADILQMIFVEIYDIIEPIVKDELKSPEK